MNVLEIRNVTVRAGSRTLLERVSFEASPGEVVAIIGPNGAGKTTLLDVVVGLRHADSGAVTFDGRALRSFAECARAFAYLPDAAEPAPELTVRALIEHALRHRAREAGLVNELRESLGIASLLGAPCGLLSRGERQRVTLFCAFAIERPVIVLDEPFNAFDPLRLRGVLGAVRRVARAGVAIVTTVHQLGDAEKIADRVLFLAEGRRIAWGDLASLRAEACVPNGPLEEVFIELLGRSKHAP